MKSFKPLQSTPFIITCKPLIFVHHKHYPYEIKFYFSIGITVLHQAVVLQYHGLVAEPCCCSNQYTNQNNRENLVQLLWFRIYSTLFLVARCFFTSWLLNLSLKHYTLLGADHMTFEGGGLRVTFIFRFVFQTEISGKYIVLVLISLLFYFFSSLRRGHQSTVSCLAKISTHSTTWQLKTIKFVQRPFKSVACFSQRPI